MSIDDRTRAFVLELSALTRKHGIAIGACGCCGSPYFGDLDDDDRRPDAGYSLSDVGDELRWVAPGDWELDPDNEYRREVIR